MRKDIKAISHIDVFSVLYCVIEYGDMIDVEFRDIDYLDMHTSVDIYQGLFHVLDSFQDASQRDDIEFSDFINRVLFLFQRYIYRIEELIKKQNSKKLKKKKKDDISLLWESDIEKENVLNLLIQRKQLKYLHLDIEL